MTPTVEQIIDGILYNELHADERGQPWEKVKAREQQADRGGLTKAGITVKTLGEWRRLGRQASRAELSAMTEDECRAIYYARYVKPFEAAPDPLRSLLVDWAVTSGQDDPTSALQQSLRSRGLYVDVVDGVFGAKTKQALLNDPDQRRTYTDVFKMRLVFYRGLALKDADVQEFLRTHPKSQLHNLAGWQNRALAFTLA